MSDLIKKLEENIGRLDVSNVSHSVDEKKNLHFEGQLTRSEYFSAMSMLAETIFKLYPSISQSEIENLRTDLNYILTKYIKVIYFGDVYERRYDINVITPQHRIKTFLVFYFTDLTSETDFTGFIADVKKLFYNPTGFPYMPISRAEYKYKYINDLIAPIYVVKVDSDEIKYYVYYNGTNFYIYTDGTRELTIRTPSGVHELIDDDIDKAIEVNKEIGIIYRDLIPTIIDQFPATSGAHVFFLNN